MKARVITIGVFVILALPLYAAGSFTPDKPNRIAFAPTEARFVRLLIRNSLQSQPCIDELEIYGSEGGRNLALASAGAKATASSCLPGYRIHQIAHLNDGLYGNSHSWIAAGIQNEWVQIEFPKPVSVAMLVFTRDREGRYRDRLPASIEIRISTDGTNWKTVARSSAFPILPEGQFGQKELLRYAFECEDLTWRKFVPSESASRVLRQMEEMLERFSAQGLDVSRERREVAEFYRRERLLQGSSDTATRQEHFFHVRMA
ncbi:MAG: discoidin domain-containing protein [Planctomycetota bacterium]|jgi:hypothetical protein